MKRWSIDAVVMSLGLTVLLLCLAELPDERIASCGASWRRQQGTFSCGDHEVSFAALAQFPRLRVLLLEHVTLVESPTLETFVAERFVSATSAVGRDLTTVEVLGVQTMAVPEWLMQRLPNLTALTVRDVDFDFSWLRYTPALKTLAIARMKVPSPLPVEQLPALKEVDFVLVPNASEIELAIRTARPDIKVRIFL